MECLSSAKLQTSVYSGRKNKSFKHILKRRGPKTDLWGTPFNNVIQELNLLLTLVLTICLKDSSYEVTLVKIYQIHNQIFAIKSS